MYFSSKFKCHLSFKRVWRNQRGNQKSLMEEGQRIQWPKEKIQKDNNGPQNIKYNLKIVQFAFRSVISCTFQVNLSVT
jgi:hypothetical protein